MTHADPLLGMFLDRQLEEGMDLAAASDLLDLAPVGPPPVAAYLARFRSTGLVRRGDAVVEHDDFLVGVRFPDAYLRAFDTARVLTWCEPREVWHPNILAPYVCVGRMQPGTPLADLLHQVHEIVTYQNFEVREHDALNHDACAWARRGLRELPVDRRPLRRRLRTGGAPGAPARPGA